MPKFKNTEELEQYLEQLERKVDRIYGEEKLPRSSLFSDNFIERSFAVWAHYLVANLVITGIVGALIAIFYVILTAGTISTIIHNFK